MAEEKNTAGIFSRDKPAGDFHVVLSFKEGRFISKPDIIRGRFDFTVGEIDQVRLEYIEEDGKNDIHTESKEGN